MTAGIVAAGGPSVAALKTIPLTPTPVNKENFRKDVFELSAAIEQANDAPHCPLNHHFAPGAYAREILLPAGSLVVGKIHKHAHINVISKGRVIVITETGMITMEAPYTFVSAPGTKRVVFAVEDTVWTTVHVTTETDLEKLEEEIIAPSYEALALFQEEQAKRLENK